MMLKESGKLASLESGADEEPDAAASPLDSGTLAAEPSRQIAALERVLAGAGNCTRQTAALESLRGWQNDPRSDSAARQRAHALVWRFQFNGWDEV